MTQEISSLMDGELESHEAERAIQSCCASSEAASRWREYHLIGEVLRGGTPHPTGTAHRVCIALEAEPAIVARPKRLHETVFGRVAFAAAASVATIGVVGWLGSQGGSPVPAGAVVRNPSAVQPVAHRPKAPAAAPAPEEYLRAHRQIPSPDLYRTADRKSGAKQ